ncbi:MAG: RidA family protein [Acidimicrobiia bacterium]|nr:RidA family protein [Acidimicrobiia bacterium]
MTDRQDIVPGGLEAQYEKLQFAPAVRVGDTVHVSGVIGTKPDGSVSGDAAAQFEQAFSNLGHVLSAAGCGFGDVVEMTTFHVGLQQHMRDFMRAKRAAMAGPPHSAWTAIGIVELAIPGALVEIRATVATPS